MTIFNWKNTMNNVHPTFAPFLAAVAPSPRTTIGTSEFRAVMVRFRDSQPSHNELAAALALMAKAAKNSGYLSDRCMRSVVDQLEELANEVDQDLVNQLAEQA